MLLPFALIVTGCSGNLKKGSIFNEKFMKYNFGSETEAVASYEAQSKVDLATGADIKTVMQVYAQPWLLKVTKNDDKYGYFNVAENKYVLPVDEWAGTKFLDNGIHHVVIGLTVDAESVKHFKAFDEHGGEICSGEYENEINWDLTNVNLDNLNPGYVSRNEREDGEAFRSFLKIDNILRAVITFNVDGSIKEVVTPEKYIEANPYLFLEKESGVGAYTYTYAEYGHKELIVHTYPGSTGVTNVVYNKDKGKVASQFVVPSDDMVMPNVTDPADPILIGDYYYFQRYFSLNERATKYDVDYLVGGKNIKLNVETFRINYTNGKTEKVKTKFFLEDLTGYRSLYDKKGIYKLEYLDGVREIKKDKTLGEPRSIIVNESFKEVADISGIPFGKNQIRQFGKDKYLNTVSHVVYNEKFKEVGYLASNSRISTLPAKAGKALVNEFGKVIYGGADVQEITGLSVEDYYVVGYKDKTVIVKVEEETAKVVKELSSDYVVGATNHGSQALITVTDKESKKFLLDVTTGNMTEEIAKEDGSTLVGDANRRATLFGGSLYVEFTVYQRADKSCYVIRNATNVAISYEDFKK